jgi:hypothetical protein
MVVTQAAADAGELEDRRLPTSTLDGWRRFVRADPAPVDLLPAQRWAKLPEPERRGYDEARIAHHAELVVVTTSAIQEITDEGRLLTLMNQREIGARRGLMVSGAAATGKTTAIKQLGRVHELRVCARFPGAGERIPVVYVTCPPKGSTPQACHGVRPLPGPAPDRGTAERHRHSRRRLPGTHRRPHRPGHRRRDP